MLNRLTLARPAAALTATTALSRPSADCTTIPHCLFNTPHPAAGRLVDGRPTSLLDLGYQHAAIDDGWQACGSGPGGVGFHNASG